MSVLDSIPHAIAETPHERRLGIRWWLLVAAVGAVLLIGYLATAGLIALVMATATSAHFDPIVVLLAALPGWLALHQTPLTITGAPLSVLPLLPTVLVMLLIAVASGWVARRSRLRRPDQAWPVITAMGLVHAFIGTSIAVAMGGPVSAVPVDAFLSCGLTATIAATAGVANRCGLIYLVWERVEAEVWSGMRIGLLAVAALVGAGGVVLLCAICVSAPEMAAALERSGAAGDAIGATLLSILYLPNAVLAGWSFATGTGLSIGRLTAQPLHATPGPVPDLPLLAVLPTHDSAAWWATSLALPLVVGALVGTACRRVPGALSRRLLAVGVAAVVAAVGTLVLACIAGGDLGNGPIGPVTLHPVVLAAATLCWLAIPGAGVTWLAGPDIGDEPADTTDADSADETAASDPGGESADASGDADGSGDAAADAAADAVELDDFAPEIPHAREAADADPPEHKPTEIDPTEFDGDPTEADQR
ncbi:cell division protein PerM [Saccharopolyspora sp. 5N708]|uniref:cell division protein PerM n=1 Tax=Saccharopolyspora sp. 5N708 TaxID=3457424 RepID=UPI003FD0C4E0